MTLIAINPSDNTWMKLPTRSPRGLVGSSGASHGDKVYIFRRF